MNTIATQTHENVKQKHRQRRDSDARHKGPRHINFDASVTNIVGQFHGFVTGQKGGFNANVQKLMTAIVPVAMNTDAFNPEKPEAKAFSALLDFDILLSLLTNTGVSAAQQAMVRSYLFGLNGYNPSKGTNQDDVTVSHHELIARRVNEIFGRVVSPSPRKSIGGTNKRRDERRQGRNGKKPAVVSNFTPQPPRVIERLCGHDILKLQEVPEAGKPPVTTYRVVKDGVTLLETSFLREARALANPEYKP